MWPLWCILAALLGAQAQNTESNGEFIPVVTATCKTEQMSIKITTNQPFNGVVHAREFRTPACMAYGNGSESLSFDIDLAAPPGSPNFCGVFWNNRTFERSLPLAVRVHRTLELAEDKFYIITCGKAGISGFPNARNETSHVLLRMFNSKGQKVTNTAFGLPYTLRAEISNPDGQHSVKMKSCFAFNMRNNTVELLDKSGCPVKQSVAVKMENGVAELSLPTMFKFPDSSQVNYPMPSMYKFPDSSQVNFQCEIAICKGKCMSTDCSLEDRENDTGDEENTVNASTSVFVLDPSDSAVMECADPGVHPVWLLYLAIALGVMFLVMLLINCFLCTAMTCSCARTDVIEKDPSVVEDYDPYRSWHGSQYGSRYPTSTIHSARSVSDNSDHYAIVQSRPGSRHSGMHRNRH